MGRIFVVVRTNRRLKHYWPGRLKPHSHNFMFEVRVRSRGSRCVAFEDVTEDLKKVVNSLPVFSSLSCENMCDIIRNKLNKKYDVVSVSVFENDKQGAMIVW